ncbi:ABC transporter permease [bacterium]|nr:ABC transporter permease [bacterium]
MAVPFIYTVENFRVRRLASIITIVGIALVAFTFTAVLMMAHGVEKTLAKTGSPDNVIVTRKGSNEEISSSVSGESQDVLATLPGVKMTADGEPLMSAEPVVVINLHKADGGMSNVTVRGVSPLVESLRPQLHIVEGRMFNPDLRELIVGEPISKKFQGASVGNIVKFAGNDWTVVGTFRCEGSGFESEIWGNSTQLLEAFGRGNTASSVTIKLTSIDAFDGFKSALEAETRLQETRVEFEEAFFKRQSEGLTMFIRILGIFITIILGLGATVGASITMYGAVANRTSEIGTLRALGFNRRSILMVFLTESLFTSLAGTVLGILLATGLQFFEISTLNFTSFSEVNFAFAMSPQIILGSLIFGAFMGIIGGFFPSVRAARMNIVNALRTA